MSQWERPEDVGGAGWSAPGHPGGTPAPAGSSGPAAAGGPAERWGAPGWNGGPPPAPRPGIVPLRPLSLGEIWDGGFRAFRQNPRVVLGLSALVVVASSAVDLLATLVVSRDVAGFAGGLGGLEADTPGNAGEFLATLQRSAPLVLLSSLLQVVALLVLNGMLIVTVSRAVLGRTIGFGELWRVCRARLWPLVLLSLLIALLTTAVGALALAPGALVLALAGSGTGTGGGVALLVLGALAWAVAGLWLWARWSMAPPAMLLEGLGVVASLRRSAALVKGAFWRTFGILALTTVLVWFVIVLVSTPFTLVGAAVTAVTGAGDPFGAGYVLAQVVATIGTIVGSVVGYPFLASVTALLYVDLRMRREGLDVELHRAAAGG